MSRALRRELSGEHPHMDIERYCLETGIEVVDAPLGIRGPEALLAPLRGRFRVVINTQDRVAAASTAVRRHRRRFRIAHEVGHTHFYRRDGIRPRRLFPAGSTAEERFCDEFARSLLAPTPDRLLDADEVLALQARCDVSLEVAARAVSAGRGAPRVGLWWWEPRSLPDEAPIRQQWSTDPTLADDLAICAYQNAAASLVGIFEAARANLGPRFTSAILPARCQALAVIAREN
jgi:hypothetical protein